jgi:DNA processing protein
MTDERAAYVALALIPGMSHARLSRLLEACDTPLGAISAPFAFLGAVPGISRAAATAIDAATLDDGRRALDAAERLGARVLVPADADFPEALRTIPEPPLVLFALGDFAVLGPPLVGIVGSRDPSPYGVSTCRAIAGTAARAGIGVVSGMARGLDAVAHEAALDAGGGTVGVLGNGIGVIYPAANRGLYARVAAEGLLLTEHPPGERPQTWNFPRRNRLVSGLARATIVVEAAESSGTLITVSAALEQGREVLAVPGPITSPTSAGTNRLIRDGAAPYLEPDDLLRLYPEAALPARSSATGAPATQPGREPAPLPPDIGEEARRVAARVEPTGTHVDVLARRAGRTVSDLLGSLLALELAGVVAQAPGAIFRRL